MAVNINKLDTNYINYMVLDCFSKNNTKELKLYLRYYKLFQENLLNYLIVALDKKHFKIIKFIFNKRPNSKIHFKSLFHIAISDTDFDKLNFLLDYSLNYNYSIENILNNTELKLTFCTKSYIHDYLEQKKLLQKISNF